MPFGEFFGRSIDRPAPASAVDTLRHFVVALSNALENGIARNASDHRTIPLGRPAVRPRADAVFIQPVSDLREAGSVFEHAKPFVIDGLRLRTLCTFSSLLAPWGLMYP